MICPSSPLGMLLSWISLTATVSPVAQFRAPTFTINLSLFVVWGRELTVYLAERAFAKGIPELLGGQTSSTRSVAKTIGTDIVIEQL